MKIDKLIDQAPLSPYQIMILVICFSLNILDGLDVLVISFSAPYISSDLGVSLQQLGVVFSSALFGMTAGAIFISPYTDVYGRRPMVLLSLTLIAIGMFLCAFAQSVWQLSVLRFLAGLGIGSMLSSLVSLVSEYMPERRRNLALSFLQAGYPIGAILAGFAAILLLNNYGWRALFLLSSGLSVLAIPVVYFLLPESIAFLVKKQPETSLAQVNRVLSKIKVPELSVIDSSGAGDQVNAGVAVLLKHPIRQSTLMLWLSFFLTFATLYFLLSWVVKLAFDSGLSSDHAIYAGLSLNVGMFLGSVTLGYLSHRFCLSKVISGYLIMGGLFTSIYGFISFDILAVLSVAFLLMYFIGGGFTGCYLLAARLYPVEYKTTGVGWAIGAGRLGAILSPMFAGVMLGAGVSITWVFVVFAIPAVFAGVSVLHFRS